MSDHDTNQPLAEKEIKLKRALILGNFYNQKVKIVQAIDQGYKTVYAAIAGLKKDVVLTQDGQQIPRDSIRHIYQLVKM